MPETVTVTQKSGYLAQPLRGLLIKVAVVLVSMISKGTFGRRESSGCAASEKYKRSPNFFVNNNLFPE